MRLISLQLTDFGPHTATKIAFDRVNIFVGPHGAGKTYIRDAIQYAITGSCRAMKGRTGESGVIRQGAAKAVVEMVFAMGTKPYTINRLCTGRQSILKITLPSGKVISGLTTAQDRIYEVLDITADVANMLFDVFDLAKMTARARKELLQRFVTTGGADKLMEYLDGKGHGEMPQEFKDRIIVCFNVDGLGDDKKGAYGYAVEMRRDYKREEKALEKPAAAPEDAGDPEKIRERLEELGTERDQLISGAGHDTGRAETLGQQIQALKTEQDVLKPQLSDKAELRRQQTAAQIAIEQAETVLAAANQAATLNEAVAARTTEAEGVEAEIEKLSGRELCDTEEGLIKKVLGNAKKAMEDLRSQSLVAGVSDDEKALAQILFKMESLGDAISKKSFTAVKAAIDIERKGRSEPQEDPAVALKEAEERYAEVEKDLENFRRDRTDLEILNAQLKEIAKAIARDQVLLKKLGDAPIVKKAADEKDVANQELTNIGDRVSHQATLRLRADGIAEKLPALEKELAGVQANQTQAKGTSESTLKIIDGRIRNNREQLELATQAESSTTALEKYQAEQKSLAVRITRWDDIANALNPKNPELVALFGDPFTALQERIKAVSIDLGIPAELKPDFSIEVHTSTFTGGEAWASHSEQYRVGIALQAAICSLLGVQTMIIDYGETLIDEVRGDLSHMVVAGIPDILTTILLASGKAALPTSLPEGVKGFPVQDGAILREAVDKEAA